MNLVILKTNAYFGNNKQIFDAMELLGHNFLGFVALGEMDNIAEVDGCNFYPTEYIHRLKYDLALIDQTVEVAQQFVPLLANLNIPLYKIRTYYWLLQQIMIKKYEDIKTLAYWEDHELSVFNQHMEDYDETLDEVFIDESCNLPYIHFKTIEGKTRRMYCPRDGSGQFKDEDGINYVRNILREQVPTSPHLYVADNHKVEDGDVLIDVGVCEGNFALRYADICSKIYLFEPTPKWAEPLYYSFKDCWNKVEFIPKFVADSTRGSVTALDDVVSLPLDSKIFLKMDIEGAEPAALRGAKKILTTNKVKASVCSYHNADDLVKIKSIFQKYDYKIATSAGYMIFIYDPKIWETADFRKGIVYAQNF